MDVVLWLFKKLLSERELIAYMFTAKSIRVIPRFALGTSTSTVVVNEHKHYSSKHTGPS